MMAVAIFCHVNAILISRNMLRGDFFFGDQNLFTEIYDGSKEGNPILDWIDIYNILCKVQNIKNLFTKD